MLSHIPPLESSQIVTNGPSSPGFPVGTLLTLPLRLTTTTPAASVPIHKLVRLSSKSLTILPLLRSLSSNVLKWFPSKRAKPLPVPSKRYPSRVCVIEMTEFWGRPSPSSVVHLLMVTAGSGAGTAPEAASILRQAPQSNTHAAASIQR